MKYLATNTAPTLGDLLVASASDTTVNGVTLSFTAGFDFSGSSAGTVGPGSDLTD